MSAHDNYTEYLMPVLFLIIVGASYYAAVVKPCSPTINSAACGVGCGGTDKCAACCSATCGSADPTQCVVKNCVDNRSDALGDLIRKLKI
jgi:hypothetical protein